MVTAPLVGASSKEQIDDAVASLDLALMQDEIQQLEAPYTPGMASKGSPTMLTSKRLWRKYHSLPQHVEPRFVALIQARGMHQGLQGTPRGELSVMVITLGWRRTASAAHETLSSRPSSESADRLCSELHSCRAQFSLLLCSPDSGKIGERPASGLCFLHTHS